MADRIAFSDCSYQGKIEHARDYILLHPEATKKEVARHFRVSQKRISRYAQGQVFPREKNARAYLLESRIKHYILKHKEVRQQDLIRDLKSSQRSVKKCLEKAGICLLPKIWHTENRVLREYNQGANAGDISEKLGLHQEYTQKIIRGLPLSYCLKRYILEHKEVGIESLMRETHSSSKEIKQALDKAGISLWPKERRGVKKNFSRRDELLRKGYSQTWVGNTEEVGRAAIYKYLERNPKIRKEWEEKRRN